METDPRFSGEAAYAHLRVLAGEIGPRHGGSSGELQAAHFIRDHFRGLGLKVSLKPYRLYSFEDARAELRHPGGDRIPCVAVPMTAATPARGLTRGTVFLEDANPAFLDARVRGKIVITFNRFSEAGRERLHALKPAGLVLIQTSAHTRPLRRTYSAELKRKIGGIPTVQLALKDGMALVEAHPPKLALRVATAKEKVTKGYNVVTDLQGDTAGDDDVIVVCAHYDSVWGGPGAFDNGGGIAAVMELARVFAESGVPRTLRFIAFGGEEMGLWGARAYVKTLKNKHDRLRKNKNFERDGLKTDLERLRFVVNVDMAGALHGKSNAISLGHTDIAASARLLAGERRYALNVRENEAYSSDNMPFNYAGIPSLSFNRVGFGAMGGHTELDVIDNCSADGLAHMGGFVESWITRHAFMHVFPFSRELPEVATEAVNKYFKKRDPLDYDVYGPAKRYKPKRP